MIPTEFFPSFSCFSSPTESTSLFPPDVHGEQGGMLELGNATHPDKISNIFFKKYINGDSTVTL